MNLTHQPPTDQPGATSAPPDLQGGLFDQTAAATALPPIVEAPSTIAGEPQTNEERFEAFHAANPHVYLKLREIARHVQAKGVTRFGIAAAFERLRWIYLETHGETYRLNNTYRAFYARLLMQREPDLRGLFETRGLHD